MKTICVVSTPKNKQAPFIWNRKPAEGQHLVDTQYFNFLNWIELNPIVPQILYP